MAFDSLSAKLADVFKKLRGVGKLTEKDVTEAMVHVRRALLEADVSFRIVKEFISNVTAKAVGDEVLKSLTPGQHVIKIVNEELISLMGTTNAKLTFSTKLPTVYMLVGLQGAGKTTAAGKIAGQLRKQGKKPLLVACDVYRPAAVKQLMVVGSGYGVPVFELGTEKNPVDIAKSALDHAERMGNDVVIIDTAGRLHIDDELMDELKNIKAAVQPQEILLVVDAMTGQDAVNVAENFSEKIGVDGVIVTKLDSDTRGGAVLSVRKITGKPIKFVGMGERMDELEAFHPDRMANRILGMGDVLTLIEKAESALDEEEVAKLEKKLKRNEFDLDDFLSQIQQIKKMGPLKNVLGMIPGLGNQLKGVEVDERGFVGVEAIIRSMTPQERRNPDVLNASRKRRISAGSGRSVQEINQLLKQFDSMKVMFKQFSDTGKQGKGKKGKFNLPF